MQPNNQHSDEREVFFCECGTNEHMLIVDHYHWEPGVSEFYLQPALVTMGWRERIGVAWRYLMRRPYHAFHDFQLDTDDVVRLRDSCNRYLNQLS